MEFRFFTIHQLGDWMYLSNYLSDIIRVNELFETLSLICILIYSFYVSSQANVIINFGLQR